MDINSKEYWDQRFNSNHWVNSDGAKQSEFFVEIAVNAFPVWLIDAINQYRMGICDVGCAQGEGTALLKKYFPDSTIIGVDFSESAVEIAKSQFPLINFYCEDITSLSPRHDVIFTSNVLEHFENPIEILGKLADRTERYLVVLVPYKEYRRISEHFYTFDADTFPPDMNDLQLVYQKEIDCRHIPDTKWPGEELLVVYTRKTAG